MMLRAEKRETLTPDLYFEGYSVISKLNVCASDVVDTTENNNFNLVLSRNKQKFVYRNIHPIVKNKYTLAYLWKDCIM